MKKSFEEINEIHRHIKKFLIEKILKSLLELKFKSNHSIITKPSKRVVKKHFTKLQKKKNTQSKIKPIKVGKQSGTTYCFGCKDYTKNFRPEKLKKTNIVLREKKLLICRSNESRFFKLNIN